jgi:hypothetical protein
MNRHANYGIVDQRNLRPAARTSGWLTSSERDHATGGSNVFQLQAEEQAAAAMRVQLPRPLLVIPDPSVQVKVLEAIRAGSPVREVQAGEIVELPKTLAAALAAIGRVQMV